MNLEELLDIKVKRSVIIEYNSDVMTSKVPLIIDNGSYQCRVGWSSCENPVLSFRNLIAKPRKDRRKDCGESIINPPIQIGNDILNIEAMRFQLKTQFDRNVITHYQNQEQIFDYIFSSLGMDGCGSFDHPLVLTEAIGNPNFCRQIMTELVFELYGAPSVCYCIDSLCSAYRNQIGPDGLVISFGYHTTHVIPLLNGIFIFSKARRLNVGGFHIITYLYRLMQMKYPVHLHAITISRMEALLQKHCFIAVDYLSELKKWAQPSFYDENVMKIQLPYSEPSHTINLTTEQKFEKKKDISKRLGDIKAKQHKEQLSKDQDRLNLLQSIKKYFEINNFERFEVALKENDIKNLEELEQRITNIQQRVELAKQKHCIPSRIRTNLGEDKVHPFPQPPENVSTEYWVNDVKHKRFQILEKKNIRKIRRQDLANRRTAAAQERMRIISQLARKEKGSDDFGTRDEDWNVYRIISRDNDTDSEVENEKLIEYEDILRYHDPLFEEPTTVSCGIAENHQLHVGVELIRAPELLFQPSMIGSPEAGLAELIKFVLSLFENNEQAKLCSNVFMTGGCANFSGLKERISKELLEMRPEQSYHNVVIAEVPNLDSWLGAKDFTKSADFESCLTTADDYAEKGCEYFKEHPNSNKYFPTPKALRSDIES